MNRKIFFFLLILCIIGSWSVYPFVQYLTTLPASGSIVKVFLVGLFQTALFFGIILWLSFKILSKTDLHPFSFQNSLKRIVFPAVFAGVFVGFAISFVDKALFHSSHFSEIQIPFWMKALASIYGGVNEEVLMRLFLFTLIYFVFCKCFRVNLKNRAVYLWVVNVVVALLFGLGHLPMAFKVASLTDSSLSALDISRIFFLNGIGGLVFGWLYWSNGLWTAMGAHFVADLVIQLF